MNKRALLKEHDRLLRELGKLTYLGEYREKERMLLILKIETVEKRMGIKKTANHSNG